MTDAAEGNETTSATAGHQPTTVGLDAQSDATADGVPPDPAVDHTDEGSYGVASDLRVLRRSVRTTRGKPPSRYMFMLSNAVQLVKQVMMADTSDETGYDADSE